MKTKNVVASIVCLLTLVLCVVGLSSCGKKCVHQWGDWTTTKEATCTETGAKEQTCSLCGIVNESVIDQLKHDWAIATCTKARTCKKCYATDGKATGHFFTKDVVKDDALKTAANCQSAAIYYKSCSCGEVGKDDVFTYAAGGLGGHSYDAATCAAPATCKFCKETKGETLAHTWVAATCVAPKTCSACKATEGKALGHKFVGGTCVEAKVCSVCNVNADSVPGHAVGAPSCDYDEACLSCGLIHGDKLEHKVNGAEECKCIYCETLMNHIFSQEVVHNDYLVPGETNKYYKSCLCGEKGTETFTAP